MCAAVCRMYRVASTIVGCQPVSAHARTQSGSPHVVSAAGFKITVEKFADRCVPDAEYVR